MSDGIIQRDGDVARIRIGWEDLKRLAQKLGTAMRAADPLWPIVGSWQGDRMGPADYLGDGRVEGMVELLRALGFCVQPITDASKYLMILIEDWSIWADGSTGSDFGVLPICSDIDDLEGRIGSLMCVWRYHYNRLVGRGDASQMLAVSVLRGLGGMHDLCNFFGIETRIDSDFVVVSGKEFRVADCVYTGSLIL